MSSKPVAPGRTLAAYLHEQGGSEAIVSLVRAVGDACADISRLVSRGALAGLLARERGRNVQGEVQQELDALANDILTRRARDCAWVAALASEEEEDIVVFDRETGTGRLLLLFDPLDGSSNIDVNAPIGTIFSVLPLDTEAVTVEAFLQPGRNQLAAGYAIYGPQTTLVLTLGSGVAAFTLDPDSGEWIQVSEGLSIPPQTREFAINMSNRRHWAEPVRSYIDACLAGREGPREKDFNMRWVASMVADVHRILTRGGVFLYPWDNREPGRPGRLRLMYEANPLGLVVERAGGAATDGRRSILDIQPSRLHERVAVVLGSAEEVAIVTAAHR